MTFFSKLWALLRTGKVSAFRTTDKELDSQVKPPAMIPDGGFNAGKGDGRTYTGIKVDISLPGGEK